LENDHTRERRRLLDAILPHVVFDGWTHQALKAGTADLGWEPWEQQRCFPGGPGEAIEFFSSVMDRRMLDRLAELELDSMRVRDKVASAVRFRLEELEPHKEAVRRGLGFFALPMNAAAGTACLYRTVDAIWHGIGDRSTDYNFYTKRLLLAGVVSTTTVFWLDDKSDGHEATWAFLERRIDEVLKVGGRMGKTLSRIMDLPDRLFAVGARRASGARR
jgi:ubiquinone biosynthesis protein COQ9